MTTRDELIAERDRARDAVLDAAKAVGVASERLQWALSEEDETRLAPSVIHRAKVLNDRLTIWGIARAVVVDPEAVGLHEDVNRMQQLHTASPLREVSLASKEANDV